MKCTTPEESTVNNLCLLELALKRHLEAAQEKHHYALAAHLEAMLALSHITKAAALDAVGGKRDRR